MLMKIMVVVSIMIALTKFSGMVPSTVFQDNVSHNENRSLLNLVDSALVTYYCNHPGQLPEKLDDIEDLGVEKGILNSVFEYSRTDGQTKFSLKIKDTGEYSANSNRELIATALDFSKDENGAVVTVAKEPTAGRGISISADRTMDGLGASSGTDVTADTATLKNVGLWVNYDDGSSSNKYSLGENSAGSVVLHKEDFGNKGNLGSEVENVVVNDKQLNAFADATGTDFKNINKVGAGTGMSIDEFLTSFIASVWGL